MKQLLAAAFAACLFASPVSAQTTDFFVKPDSDTVAQGQLVCVPIRVQGFNDMIGLLFVLNWDPQVLTFHHTQAYNLPYLDSTLLTEFPVGRLAVAWGPLLPQGVSLPDGTAIFEICFVATGDNGDCTNVALNGSGVPSASIGDAISSDGLNHWTSSSGIAGQVCIQGSVSIHETDVTQPAVKIYPNPAADWLTVAQTEAFSGEASRFEVLDLMGRTLRSVWLSGEKTEISLEDLPAGMYLWQLRIGENVVQTGRIVRQ